MKLFKENLPLYNAICNLCADYNRRECAMISGVEPLPTLLEYRRLNEAIDRGIALVCEDELRGIMLKEIANHIGANKSEIPYRSTFVIKKLKQESVCAIARELHWMGE